MSPSKSDNLLLILLRLGAFGCFAGWAWVHLYWEGPYGVLLWQDATFALADRLGVSWDEFVGSGAQDGLVQVWHHRIGWLYLICAILTLTVRTKSRIQMAGLIGGSGLLVILSYAKYLSARQQLPMFVEHGGQMLIPVILVLALAFGVRHRATVIVASVAFVMTFAGHGAYALGFPCPTPANFLGMTSVILKVEAETARTILHVAGALDFLVCLGIFIRPLRKASALYAVIWGFLTALARPVAGMSLALNYWGADQYFHELVLRAPHFMIPLYLLFLWRTSEAFGTLTVPAATPEDNPDPQTCRPAAPLFN
ncbi:MAG: hypothetical protein P1U68_16645 [Verrucomicrobiales bacterium]|nr:hypothetical protein [Verrucomicrobiales bacterium]